MLRTSLAIAALASWSLVQAQTVYDAKILEYTGLRYACEGSGTPVLKIQNAGSASMGTCVVETWKNGIMANSFNWVLAVPSVTGEVRQPALPAVPAMEPGDELEFRIISVNGNPDEDADGNLLTVPMDEIPSLSQGGSMEVRIALGDDPGAIAWEVTDALNQVVAAGGPYDEANSEVVDELDLPPGCYTFKAQELQRLAAPDATVTVERAGNVLLAANDLSTPYARGLKSGTEEGCANALVLDLNTDALGSEVRWEILSSDGSTRYCESTPYADAAEAISAGGCVPDGCYRLVVTDAGGDGIAGGGYTLRTGSARLIDNGHDALGRGGFTDGAMSAIASGEGFCLPIGTDRLLGTSCDKLDWRTGPGMCNAEYVVANDNPAVSAQYGVSNASSGYQMWWYDPNGGYSFKRIQYHSSGNGLAASAVRACHFRINAWGGNQLEQGAFCNVKVRGIVDGTFLPWGPACRFMVNSAEAQCPRAKLMDLPGNVYLSCGQTVAVGDLVHARPVRRMLANCTWQNANRYQFRFRIPEESVNVVKSSAVNSAFVYTTGLECGAQYEVDVRASFDGGATWCYTGANWGEACSLTTAPCASSGQAELQVFDGDGLPSQLKLRLFPNPAEGGTATLRIEGEQLETAGVEMHDAAGRLLEQWTVPATDGFMQLQVPTAALVPGVYIMSARMGGQVVVERLMVR